MTDRQTVSTDDYAKLKAENEKLELVKKSVHNFLFDNADSLPDDLFYQLRAIIRD